ncbi:hypothetical protein ES703_45727 [subsurface metagenome]
MNKNYLVGFSWILWGSLFIFSFNIHAKEIRITSIGDNRQDYPSLQVPKYEKLEISFDVQNLVAQNVYFPYDAEPIGGLQKQIGVTVDGLFLAPGESDWNKAVVQPAFWYQPMKTEAGSNFVYPVGNGSWKIRFAPTRKGNWKYKVRVQDESICNGALPCNKWIESAVYNFSVGNALSRNHGFVEVSPHDSRYFRFSDGSEFIALGHEVNVESFIINLNNPEPYFKNLAKYGANLIRTWMTSSLVVGRGTHGWDPWRKVERVGAKDRIASVPYGYHDFSLRLSGNGDYIFTVRDGHQPLASWLEAGKTYIVRIRAKLDNVVASGPEPSGLVLKFLKGPYNNFTSSENTSLLITSKGWKGSTDFAIFETSFTNPFGRRAISQGAVLAVGLQNVSSGKVYLDEIYAGEDLSSGQTRPERGREVGPNILFKGQLNYHLYFDQMASHLYDQYFEKAKEYGVYVKSVILEKNDPIYNSFSLTDGSFQAGKRNNNNFYAKPNTKVRRLHEYFWRYLAARWGYCTAVHSWELLNEGDPHNELHYGQANALKRAMQKWDRNHMVTTSFWHSFPTKFWRNTICDYADVHAYVSTSYAPKSEKEKMQYDAAYYHIWHSRDIFYNRNPNKPVVRGEAGLDFPNRQAQNRQLEKDTQGVWFHNYLWAGLYSGGMYELYWWTDDVYNKSAGYDHRDEFLRVREFVTGLELAKGGYVDWAGKVDNNNVRVVGQKNLAKWAFHLWVQNKKHTWKNVVDGISIRPENASITIGGFRPNQSFRVEWWDTYKGKIIQTEQVTVGSDLVLTLPYGLTTDIAVKAIFK